MKAYQFEAIGTTWSIELPTIATSGLGEQLESEIQKRIELFDKTYSRFRADSLVTKLSKQPDNVIFPDDSRELLSLYKKLYTLTSGAFTPLIGDVLISTGYDASYSLTPSRLSKPPAWDDVLTYEYPNVSTKMPTMLDFGAGGKGYLVDIIAKILDKHHITSYTIDASGDILYKNEQSTPLRIGLEHPQNSKEAIGIATITNESICGSAGNRRSWNTYHHIINPKTLTSPTEILSVWVVAKTALIADALATALFLAPAKTFASEFLFEYVTIKKDYTLEKSAHFPGEFFYN